jgi:hypothetical protein
MNYDILKLFIFKISILSDGNMKCFHQENKKIKIDLFIDLFIVLIYRLFIIIIYKYEIFKFI